MLPGYNFKPVYEASTSNLVDHFYLPALTRARTYDRAVGYFRSSIFHLVQIAISDFILREGRMRLICSPSLAAEDHATIKRTSISAAEADNAILQDIQGALRDPETLPVIELLATMIVTGSLDIKVAYSPTELGIFHSKVGIFGDRDGNFLSFEGSPNETYMAWAHNEERFRVFRSWISGDTERVAEDQVYFDDLWHSRRPRLVVRALPEIADELLRKHAQPDPQIAIERVRIGARGTARRTVAAPKRLHDHQLQVLDAWRSARRGIVDHVTGGGKTITAIACIRDWLASEPDATVLIVIPTDLLANQWQRELRQELLEFELAVLQVGGTNTDPGWRTHLRNALAPGRRSRRFITIATMDSAASADFLRHRNAARNMMLVVDEVHKVGSRVRRRVLEFDARARLGLSATPERMGDPEGTATIFDYFGDVLKPSFGIREAQSVDPPRLVQYMYHLHVVTLTDEEEEDYIKATRRIAALRSGAHESADGHLDTSFLMACIRRSRILKNAAQKVGCAQQILEEHYATGQRWLVYCDSTKQLDELQIALEPSRLPVARYLSSMDSSKPDTLDRFESIGGILLSVRCLDEGIDIPVVTHALVLASSSNPREHIQRRGRVLRTAPGKHRASIHDLLVARNNEDDDPQVFGSEIARASIFGADAINTRQIRWQLDGWSNCYEDEHVDYENEELEVEDD